MRIERSLSRRHRIRLCSLPVVFGATVFLLGALIDWPTVDHVREVGPWAGRLLAVFAVVWTAAHLRDVREPGLVEVMSVLPGGYPAWIQPLLLPALRVFLHQGASILAGGWIVGLAAVLIMGSQRCPWWLGPSLAAQAVEIGIKVWAGLWLTAYASTCFRRSETVMAAILVTGAFLEMALPSFVHRLSWGWVRQWSGPLSEPWFQDRQGAILFGSVALGWIAKLGLMTWLGFWARQRLLRPGRDPEAKAIIARMPSG